MEEVERRHKLEKVSRLLRESDDGGGSEEEAAALRRLDLSSKKRVALFRYLEAHAFAEWMDEPLAFEVLQRFGRVLRLDPRREVYEPAEGQPAYVDTMPVLVFDLPAERPLYAAYVALARRIGVRFPESRRVAEQLRLIEANATR